MSSLGTDQALERQFVAIRRRFIRTDWAELWWHGSGAGVSLLPLLALLARGYGEKGAASRADRLAALSGLDKRTLQNGYDTLLDLGHVHDLPANRGVRRFVINPTILGTTGTPQFYLTGSFFAAGLWATLSPSERCVLIGVNAAVSCITDNHWIVWRSFMEWLEQVGAIAEKEDPGGSERLRPSSRAGKTTLANLARVTGVDRSSIQRALARLAARSEHIIDVEVCQQEHWFHLPSRWWVPWCFGGP